MLERGALLRRKNVINRTAADEGNFFIKSGFVRKDELIFFGVIVLEAISRTRRTHNV